MGDRRSDDDGAPSGFHSPLPRDGVPDPILDLDTAFSALAHRRRRYLLEAMFADGLRELEAIAARVVAREQGVARNDVPPAELDRVCISLYHTHVPRLVDEDVVAFDESTGVVEPGPNAESVVEMLRALAIEVRPERVE